MTMNIRFESRGPITVAEPFEIVAGNDVDVVEVLVVDVINFVVVSNKEPLGIHTPLIFVSPGSHLNGTTSKIDCCISSPLPRNNNNINSS